MVEPGAAPRHSALVRVTHWISALSFRGLVLSGITILLAHPRLYWGEAGALGTPSLIDLPLPFVLEIPIRGPGRYLHFLFAWLAVFTGLVYVSRGLVARHFGRNLLPARHELTLGAIGNVVRKHLRFERSSEAELATYRTEVTAGDMASPVKITASFPGDGTRRAANGAHILQRLSYTTVVFVLFPELISSWRAPSFSFSSCMSPWSGRRASGAACGP